MFFIINFEFLRLLNELMLSQLLIEYLGQRGDTDTFERRTSHQRCYERLPVKRSKEAKGQTDKPRFRYFLLLWIFSYESNRVVGSQ